MRGYALDHARQERRRFLRRAASSEGFAARAFLVLDDEELVQRAALSDVGAYGEAVKRRLILNALGAAGIATATVAAAWRVSADQMADWKLTPLVDKSGVAASIEAQVLDELPETDEPHQLGAAAL